MKKVSDEILIESYHRHYNIWKVGEEVGLCGQSVWERISKLGLIDKTKRTKRPREFDDWEILKNQYQDAVSKKGGLDDLARKLGRTKHFICRKAREIGLTDLSRPKQDHIRESISINTKKYIEEKGHPRGYLGHNHSLKAKRKISEHSKKYWDSMSEDQKHDQICRMSLARKGVPLNRVKASWKCGYRNIDGKNIYFRSSWEYKYAKYLQEVKKKGLIRSWEYEGDKFYYNGGRNSFTLDFKVTTSEGVVEYHEVKGWLDARSKKVFEVIRTQFPEIKLILLRKKDLKALGIQL